MQSGLFLSLERSKRSTKLVNHFITLARPSNQSINDFDVLYERVTECEAERGLVANLVSVDFVGQGDVMQVIAEGVEYAEQADLLRDMGCHEVQGFHYSPPLSVDDFSELI